MAPRIIACPWNWNRDGPALPVEFARQSRDSRITLVVCEGLPAVNVLWAALDVATLADAKRVLALRESITIGNIRHSTGLWTPTGLSHIQKQPLLMSGRRSATSAG